MASFNKIQIVGYLGRNPELRYTPSGTPVCDFSMATTERRKVRDAETEEVTTWFRVTLWGRQAEVASQFLEKGRLVYVEGRLSQREWTDKDGNPRTSLEVHGTDVQFIGSRGEQPDASQAEEEQPRRAAAAQGGGRAAAPPAPPAPRPSRRPARDDMDEIPF
jgi:single-strand DNA-binding protein